jgi:hypothetical protein
MSDVKCFYLLSPELADGQHSTVTENREMVFQAIAAWMDEFHDTPGESFTVQIVKMLPEEVESLPEI